ADGHWIETAPVIKSFFLDYVRDQGGPALMARFEAAGGIDYDETVLRPWSRLGEAERRAHWATRPPWWTLPAANTLHPPPPRAPPPGRAPRAPRRVRPPLPRAVPEPTAHHARHQGRRAAPDRLSRAQRLPRRDLRALRRSHDTRGAGAHPHARGSGRRAR